MAKQAAYGTRLFIWDIFLDKFRVHHVADISGPDVSVDLVDVSAHDSPHHFNEFLPGHGDGGEVTFDLFFDARDTGHARIQNMVSERNIMDMELVLPQKTPALQFAPPIGVGWTMGTGWTTAAGQFNYSSADPTGTTLSVELVNLSLADQYEVAVTFGAASTGTATINAKFAGQPIGTLRPSTPGTQYLYFDAMDFHGLLALEVPASIAGNFSFSISAISVKGPSTGGDGKWAFKGVVTKVGLLTAVKDAVKAPVTIKVLGVPVFGTGPVLVATDTFDSYANNSDLGASVVWDISVGVMKAYNPAGDGSVTAESSIASAAMWAGAPFPAGHRSEATLKVVAGWGPTEAAGVVVRCVTGGTFYWFVVMGASWFLQIYQTGVGTAISTGPVGALVAGDKIALSVTGTGAATRLTAQINQAGAWYNVPGATNIDPGAGKYLDSGQPGIGGINGMASRMDNWAGYTIA